MAANATDERLVFSAKLKATVLLTVDATARQTSDAIGALPPGKYFVHAIELTGRCFVKMVPFVAAAASSAVATANPAAGASALSREFPLDENAVTSLVVHVQKGVNDRLQAVCAVGGTAVLAITKTGD